MREEATTRVRAWLADRSDAELLISEWSITETSSALALKLRSGQIAPRQRATGLAIFNQMIASSFVVLPVIGAHFRAAARLADRHELGLRSGDALHLAIAVERGATVHTLDKRMAAAGPTIGIAIEMPI